MDKRKKEILLAIIRDYICTAEPIGSRTIAKKYNLGISSATIRNEMSDLESLGYIEHLHTSSGRIPSSKGYRFYVDDLLKPAKLTAQEKSLIENWYLERVLRLENVFSETAKIISHLTNNISFVITPRLSDMIFRCVRFAQLDSEHIVIAVMSEAGYIENKIIKLPNGTTLQDFQNVGAVINDIFSGKSLQLINDSTLKYTKERAINSAALQKILDIFSQVDSEQSGSDIYTDGTARFMEQPEFQDVNKIRDILQMLEEKAVLKEILTDRSNVKENESTNITIGAENKYDTIRDCSVIRVTYHLGTERLGTLAVLGPTRMEYAKVIAILNFINGNMMEMLKKFLS